MGWRGTLRSLAAASRRIEREQQRNHRELLKYQQQVETLQSHQQAATEVAIYENQIDLLTSVHKDCGETWDWQEIKNSSPPSEPQYSNQLEAVQRQLEAQHQPGFLARVFGRAEAMRAESEKAIKKAIAADDSRHTAAMIEYQTKLADWEGLKQIAQGILLGDVAAFKAALDELNPFQEIHEIGRSVQLNFNDRHIEATITLHGLDHIPTETKSLLKTGNVSIKKMSLGAVNELYQRHCCSCLLRAARELFAVLPFKSVYVHGLTELLNPRTGHKEMCVVLSVYIPRATFDTLNLDAVEPVEAMRNFVHRMEFAKARGFAAVDKIDPSVISDPIGD